MLNCKIILLLVVFFIHKLNNVHTFGIPAGLPIPLPKIRLISAEKCPVNGQMTNLELKTYTIREGNLAIDAVWTLAKTITPDYTFVIDIDKWVGGNWQKGIYQHYGILCNDITTLLPKAWPQLATAFDPNAPLKCPVPAGTYTLEAFELDNESVNLPGAAAMQGRIQLTAHFYDDDEVEVECLTTVIDVTVL